MAVSSEEDLRKRLLESLKSGGTIDFIKVSKIKNGFSLTHQAQVRNRLLGELRRQVPAKGPTEAGSPLVLRAIDRLSFQEHQNLLMNSLIADHMRANGYECSLSVFLPESTNDTHTVIAGSACN
jgi:hypothetical protein